MKSPLLKIAILLVCIPLWSQTEELVWSDEFNSDGPIDSNKWFHQTQLPAGGGWYNNEAQHYTNRLENSYVSGGNLNLVAIKESFTDQGRTKEYTSARLNSKVAFKYGRMEIRAKLPTGAGTWPAIWMLGKNIDEDGGYWDNNGYGSTPWPACGEIDIMEHWGNNQNYVSSAMHTPSSYGGTFNTGGRYLSTASTAFHVYELDWNAQRMIFSVDGTVHYTYNPPTKDANTWPFDAEQYFLLNVAIEGGGANITQTAMEIDYIRVYQTEGSDGGGGGGGNPGTTSPTDAPSAPTASAADVISLFSEAYTDVLDTNWAPNWGQSTVSSLETIAGNEVRKYTNLNYIGVELDAAQYQDVSSFEKIHFDYWTADASDLSLSLISPGPSENPVSVGAISTGAWQSVDIPLSSYSTPDLSNIFQLKFEGSGTVYIDNVYFYKTGTGSGGGSGGGSNLGAPTPTKASADVISVYSDAYSSIATNTNPFWGQQTNATEIQIDGNNTLKYENLNYQGLDYSTTDVSAMEYLHLDYKTDDATALDFFLISTGPLENAYTIPIVTGSWQSIDIPLTAYTVPDLTEAFQFKTVGNGTVYLDNMYFWKAPSAAGTDTSLSALTVDGSSIADFGASKTSYSVELPAGTTVVPAVAATTTDTNASAVVTAATSIPGTTSIAITAQDGSTTSTVSIDFSVASTPPTGSSAAPTPNKAPADVISVYSDAYTSNATELDPFWGQSTDATEIQIEGNNTLKYENLNYQGLQYPVTDVSAMEFLHLDYKTDDATALDFFLISTGPLENAYTIPIVTGSWQSIDIPLTAYTVPDLTKAFQFKTVGNGTVYLDNMYFWKAPSAAGTDTSLSALTVDGSSIANFGALSSSYSVELPAGTTVVPTVAATTTDTNASAVVTAATSIPGTTTIVITAQDGVTTNTVSIAWTIDPKPQTAAPVPSQDSSDVISVYSDAYTENIGNNANPGWGQQTQTTEFQIDGNNTLEYANLNYQGFEYATTDVSAMDYVHLDYLTNDATALEFFVISDGKENAYSIPVVTGSWQSIDIPMTEYTVANLTQAFQFKTVGNGTVYLDNMYFWKAPSAAGTDTSLSALTVDGSSIADFGALKTSYSVELPAGTTVVPAVAATTTDTNASAVVTAATSIPGTTSIAITAQDGSTTSTVSIDFSVASTPPTGSSAAPTPNKAPADVISVYSDAYTSNATELDPFWGQSTDATEIQIEGNNTLKYENLNYQGLQYPVTDVSAMEFLHLDYKTDDATALDFFLISTGPLENAYTIPIVTGSWQSIDIPLTAYTVPDLTKAFQFKTVGNGTVYLDNMYFWKAPSAAGTDTSLSALTVDGSSIANFGALSSSYSVELPAGTTVVPTVAATTTDTNASAVVTAATSIPGTTTIVITAQDGVTTNTVSIAWTIDPTPTTAAPTPTWESDDVISVYSDVYTDNIANNLNPGWGQATQTTEVQIDGNNTLEYANLNYQGMEYPETDVSAMKYLHLDYFTNDATSLEFFLVTNGVDGTDETAYDIAASESFALGQWVSLDIPLIFYSDAEQDLAKAFQFKTEGNGTVYLDNMYFYDSDYASVGDIQKEAVPVAPNPTSGLINKTGDVYNVTGQIVLTNSNDLSGLPSGIYFIKVISNGNVSTSKIIKE